QLSFAKLLILFTIFSSFQLIFSIFSIVHKLTLPWSFLNKYYLNKIIVLITNIVFLHCLNLQLISYINIKEIVQYLYNYLILSVSNPYSFLSIIFCSSSIKSGMLSSFFYHSY